MMTDARLAREALHGPVAVLLTDSTGNISWCNDSALRLLGCKEADALGKPIADVLVVENPQTSHWPIGQGMAAFKRNNGETFFAFHLDEEKPIGNAHYLVEASQQAAAWKNLHDRENLWRNALEASGHAVWAFDGNNKSQLSQTKDFYCDNWKRMRGIDCKKDFNQSYDQWLNKIHPDDRDRVAQIVEQHDSGELSEVSYEYRERLADGSYKWFLARGKTVECDADGLPTRIIGIDADISVLKQQEEMRAEELRVLFDRHLKEIESARLAAEANAFRESTWRQAVGAAGHAVWSYRIDHTGPEPQTIVEFCSDEWFGIRGATTSQHELHDYDIWINRVHPDDVAHVLACTVRQAKGEEREVSFEYRERHGKGHWVWILVRGTATDFDEQGRPHRVIGIDIDISEVKDEEDRRAREAEEIYTRHLSELQQASRIAEEARQEAQALARRDMATGLANRRCFREAITELMSQMAEFTVFLIDLDHFKAINDIHGHAAGDHVLAQTARRLQDAIGDEGLAARLGGDEFGVILRHESTFCASRVKSVAATLIAEICRPINHGDLVLYVGASVGSSNHPDDGEEYDILLQHADMALYKSKSGARGCLSVFTSLMGQEAEEKAVMEADLRAAINSESIEPWFQPIVSAAGEVQKLEILARWQHPTRGFVPPDRFITVAEHIGMLPELTSSLLRKACESALSWNGVTVAINITAREACDPATPLRILDTLLRTGFPPTRLEVEVTEQALISDFQSAKQVIAALRAAGIKIYIDDFGEGYAGIGYLRELAIDGIKFDRNCVKDICDSQQAATFLRSLQVMASTLGCKTVAEGIETAEVWKLVRSIGCDLGQGYHFARPMPAKNVTGFLGIKTAAEGNVVAFSRT